MTYANEQVCPRSQRHGDARELVELSGGREPESTGVTQKSIPASSIKMVSVNDPDRELEFLRWFVNHARANHMLRRKGRAA